MTRVNLVTATERAIDFLAEQLAGLAKKEVGPCAAHGTTEMRTAATWGAALRTLHRVAGAISAGFWVLYDPIHTSYIQAPPHDDRWYVRESAKHRRTNYQEKP